MDVLVTCKYEEDPIKIEGAGVDTTLSPLYPYGSYLLPWTPEFRSDLAQNLMQPFSHPNDGSDKILLRLAHWLRRYSSLKMFTDARTDAGSTFGSGELKYMKKNIQLLNCHFHRLYSLVRYHNTYFGLQVCRVPQIHVL